ncbi:MAG: hypothetical protein ACTSQO_05085 [Candidatus Helarchaeota archaeon]
MIKIIKIAIELDLTDINELIIDSAPIKLYANFMRGLKCIVLV